MENKNNNFTKKKILTSAEQREEYNRIFYKGKSREEYLKEKPPADLTNAEVAE